LWLQCRLAASTKLLVQPTTTTNQRGCKLGFLTTTTLIWHRALLQHTNFLGLDCPCWRTMVTRV
jgi:hypothetical protein